MPKNKAENQAKGRFDTEVSRRGFLKTSALLGGSLVAATHLSKIAEGAQAGPAWTEQAGVGTAYTHCLPENQINSVCQQCNTNCGMKVKIVDGMVAKIDGNPYSPWTLTPALPYNTPLGEAALVDGGICPKGQAGIQALYDPYRIVKVLKRAGKRGENKWKTVGFEQALEEIVEGGDLFGEGRVDGLKDICTLKDPKIASALAEDAAQVAAGKMSLEAFKQKHADNLKYLIDPDHPDFGPKNNQFCLNWGRLKGGRTEMLKRLVNNALGSANTHGHTTVCQGSLYFTCKAMSDQFVEGKFSAGSKFYWQADLGNAEFVLFVGANPYEANYGPPWRANKITDGIVSGRLKIAVADPRCSKTASRAWKWLPVNPNGVGALAMAMIHWIIENKRYDAKYLANANKAAATARGEPTWTEAAWLVKIGPDGKPSTFLRGSDIGLPTEKRTNKAGVEWIFDPFLVRKGEQFVSFDPNDEKNPVEGDLLVDAETNGIKVKSVLQIYRETAGDKKLSEWAEITGLKESDIIEVAQELTSHGKKGVVDVHRGASQHTSGFYNVLAWMLVNVLIGNHDYAGGLSKATTYNFVGNKEGMPFDTSKHSGKLKPYGISIIRHETPYDKSTIFEGFPSKRVWYPFCSDIYQEVIPSMGDAYPYPMKALLLYMGTPIYALPAGHKLIEILSDPKKVPLFIVSDIIVGETSMYADYIFPDITYLERWEFSGSHPSVTPKVAPIRQPVAAPLTDTVTVFGEKMPLSLESLLLGLAQEMKLTGFGENAFGAGLHLKREEDMYLRMVANIAFGEKPDGSDKVPAASPEEIKIFEQARRHLPSTVFDANRWKAVVGEGLWPHVVYVLNRGGRFQGYHQAYKDHQLANKYGKMIGIYFDRLVTTKHSMTGKPYVGHAHYTEGPRDCSGNLLTDKAQGYDMTLITYKTITQTKSRTFANYWLQALEPRNYIDISVADAKRLGFTEGDRAKLVSASNPDGVWDFGNGRKKPMIAQVRIREGIRPGVVAFSLGFGHWAYGSGDVTIDGVTIPGDQRRATGMHGNAAMRVDPVLKNTGLVDTVGGSAVFYQSQVKVVKV